MSNTAIWISSLFRGRAMPERSDLVPDFLGNVSYDIPPTHVGKFLLLHSGYSMVSAAISTPDFSNIADFRQLQIPNAHTKYYEISTVNTETPQNTARKIANWYIELEYHPSTLQKNPITFEQGCISLETIVIFSPQSNFSHWNMLTDPVTILQQFMPQGPMSWYW